MEQTKRSQEGIEAMTTVVSSIFTNLNIGLLIYRLEVPDEPRMLRLVYVNEAASDYTGADLKHRVGKYILDAFPGLAGSDLPRTYADVAAGAKSVDLGSFEYPGDEAIEHSYYSVKAFPMPHDCVGIIFENITVRKQVQELVKKETGRK
ncbi:MAG: PAS domain-containing protein [Rhodothermales bacterium]|nr:PAS domain-containing protein [Rhodothermales bacterium]